VQVLATLDMQVEDDDDEDEEFQDAQEHLQEPDAAEDGG
jgi:hypothetical protein